MLRTVSIVTLAVWVAACGKPATSSDPDSSTAPLDMGSDVASADVDAAPAFVCPNEGEKVCGGKCVNVLISMEHCGMCDNACQPGKMTCNGEDCVCLGDRIMCGGRCYDPLTTRDHCGVCDNGCRSDEACVTGECIDISDDPIVLGVLAATNDARAAGQDCGVHGQKPPVGGVQLNSMLNAAAQAHAEDMAANNFMAHEGSDGSSPGERADRAGYGGSVGENVARAYETPEGVVAGWVDSDGHCNNLMNGGFNEMGVGYAVSQTTGEQFWAQLFGAN